MLKTVEQASQERGQPPGESVTRLAGGLVSVLLKAPAAKDIQSGIDLAGAFKLQEAQPQLLAVARSTTAPEQLRKNAVAVAVAIDPVKGVKALGEVLLNDKENITVREQVAMALAGTNRPEAHALLLRTMETAPARLQTIIALGLADSAQGGEKLLDAVGKGKASPRLLQDRAVELKLPGQGRQSRPTARQSHQGLAGCRPAHRDTDRQTPRRLPQKQGRCGGRRQGFREVLRVCHQIANKGAKVGPQLDGIGIRGLERISKTCSTPIAMWTRHFAPRPWC